MVNTVPVPVYTVPFAGMGCTLPTPYTGIRGFPRESHTGFRGVLRGLWEADPSSCESSHKIIPQDGYPSMAGQPALTYVTFMVVS
jgi:hypothetical protein